MKVLFTLISYLSICTCIVCLFTCSGKIQYIFHLYFTIQSAILFYQIHLVLFFLQDIYPLSILIYKHTHMPLFYNIFKEY